MSQNNLTDKSKCYRCGAKAYVRYSSKSDIPVLPSIVKSKDFTSRTQIKDGVLVKNSPRGQLIESCIGCISPGGSRETVKDGEDGFSHIASGTSTNPRGAIERYITNAILLGLQKKEGY